PSNILAAPEVGAIPYYSGWKTIDLLGLNDEWLARHGVARINYLGRIQYVDTEYVLGRKPTVVILLSDSPSQVSGFEWNVLFQDSRMEQYERLGVLRITVGRSYWYHVFARKDYDRIDPFRSAIADLSIALDSLGEGQGPPGASLATQE
ncbi:MAG: hypothetical protein Q8O76_07695, partial [Chloroflexota bacterium]|nr:hypothetical protein [Chloroflexota bacterium]